MRPIQRQADAFAYRFADTAPLRLAALTQDLVDSLDDEFHDWFIDRGRKLPRGYTGGSQGPLGHWPNIENFLKDKYPAAHRGFDMGLEEAQPLLDNQPNLLHEDYPEYAAANPRDYSQDAPYPTGPEAEAEHGYDPKEIASAMLLLHNKSHPFRQEEVGSDVRRLYDIFQKRQKMQRNYEERQRAAYRHVRLAYSEALSSSPLTDDTIYGLGREFQEWATKNNKSNPYDEVIRDKQGEAYEGLRRRNPAAYTLRGPVGYWPNIEDFLKEKYPAAHRGLSMGFEDATPLLDKGEAAWLPGKAPYETGEQALTQYGYDPKEIAAAMLILHNGTHPGRDDWDRKDQARLIDIVQKRHKMQQAYDSRPKVARLIEAVTLKELDDVNGLLGTLEDEYNEWYADNGDERYNWAGRGPLGNWRQIENFLQTKYPAAYRGYNTGHESAGDVLDNNDDYAASHDDVAYPTGPQAVAQHGYDPAEVVAGMLYLHNQSHPSRASDDEWLRTDTNRLVDIARKRMKMQRDYEVRTTTPAPAGSTQRTPDANTSAFDLKYAPEYSQHRIDKAAAQTGGDCYEAAAHYMLNNAYGKGLKNLRVVHGEVAGQGPLQGKTFGHAWVEDGDTVIDQSNGRNIVMPKAQYYALGKINELNNTHVYNWEQARDKMLEHNIYGPWDLQGKHPNYVEGPKYDYNEDDEDDDDDWYEDDEYDDEDPSVHTAYAYDDGPYYSSAWDDEDDDEEEKDEKPHHKHALDHHGPSFGKQRWINRRTPYEWTLADHLPTDLDWRVGDPPWGGGVQDEEKSGKWYHASPYDLKPGERIIPQSQRDVPNPNDDFYDQGKANRQNYVWLSSTMEKAQHWAQYWAGPHIYEVDPGDTPQQFNLNKHDGWVAPHATVKRKVAVVADAPSDELVITKKEYPRSGESSWHAHHNGNEVGHLWVVPSGFTAGTIADISVDPSYHRQGIATKLWEAAGRPAHTGLSLSPEGRAWAGSVGGDVDTYGMDEDEW